MMGETQRLYEALLLVGKMLGMSRSVGMVFAILYTCEESLSVETIMQETRLSKSAVSLALRDLLRLGAVQEIGVLGERCRYYTGKPDLAWTVRQMMLTRLQPALHEFREKVAHSPVEDGRMAQAQALLATFDDMLMAINAEE